MKYRGGTLGRERGGGVEDGGVVGGTIIGETRGGFANKGGATLKESKGGPKWVLVTDVRHAVKEPRPGMLSRGAGEDGVLEGFWFQAATGGRRCRHPESSRSAGRLGSSYLLSSGVSALQRTFPYP